MATRLTGWRYTLFMGGFVGFIALAMYPIIIKPMMNVDSYKQIRESTQPQIREDKRL